MIRKIILENYMAHVHTVIEPAAGLTVLVGPNNCGKSAIIHALEMICYNSDAASFAIRHGSKKATVTVETEDEDGTRHTLVWWRKKDTAGYIIDGREISGIGRRKIPDDLHSILRMPEIPAASGEAFRIHFGLQKSPIFLLDGQASESRTAQFFASASDADRLMEMQRRHKQKEANAKRDKEKLDLEISKLDQQLGDLSPLADLSLTLTKLELAYEQIIASDGVFLATSRSIEAMAQAGMHAALGLMRATLLADLMAPPQLHLLEPLKDQIQTMGSALLRVEVNHAHSAILVDLNQAPEMSETSPLRKLIGELAPAGLRSEVEAARVGVTQSLRSPPSQGDVLAISQTLGKLSSLTSDLHTQRQRSAVLVALPPPPSLADPIALHQQIAAMESAQKKFKQFEARHRLLDALPELPLQTETTPMAELANRMEESTVGLVNLKMTVVNSDKALSAIRLEIEDFVRRNPRCQSCGQAINPELILTGASGGHDHG